MKTRSRIRSLFARPDQRTPGKVPHRARPLVEALECRSVPAVVVTGLGGTLYIFDTDTSGHTIEVDQTATQGAFTVEVDSSSVGTFTGIKNINADLFVDSDTLSFANPSSATTNLRGDLTVWAAEPADGETEVYENFYAIKGDVSLTEGNGADDFAVCGLLRQRQHRRQPVHNPGLRHSRQRHCGLQHQRRPHRRQRVHNPGLRHLRPYRCRADSPAPPSAATCS